MKRIAVIPNKKKDKNLAGTKRLVNFLKNKAVVYMESEYAEYGMEAEYLPLDEIYNNADYAVVLGGDGTILEQAAAAAKSKVQVLGINLGTIGFMTEIEIDDMENALGKLLDGDYKTEKRMMIRAQIKSNGEIAASFHALNDIVVSNSAGERLASVRLSSGDEVVNRYIADGLIIATPTGSTGYSISAGGPVVEPRMRLFVATPICAHTLSARSAVIASDQTISVSIDGNYGCSEAIVTADGVIRGSIKDTDEVVITESEYSFELIKIGNQSFYDTLIKKLS